MSRFSCMIEKLDSDVNKHNDEVKGRMSFDVQPRVTKKKKKIEFLMTNKFVTWFKANSRATRAKMCVDQPYYWSNAKRTLGRQWSNAFCEIITLRCSVSMDLGKGRQSLLGLDNLLWEDQGTVCAVGGRADSLGEILENRSASQQDCAITGGENDAIILKVTDFEWDQAICML
jgi:hypothetical protein